MFPLRVVEHVMPCQHIREYARALANEQETVLHLHVKQYIPIDNPSPQPGDVTIIGAHANGFPKELVNVAYMHPRLFTTLILIDTVIQVQSSVTVDARPNMVQMSTFRRDAWPSRDAAVASYRKIYPDLNPIVPNIAPFYRAEGPQAYFRLQELRPSVFYVFGKESDVGPPHTCDAKMKHTGVGIGGSGGEPAGRVHRVTYQGVGHLIAMEAVSQAAGDAADWIR
ncbi:hypothetical protein H2202_010702 [Exophiala xenobiotica]|nr:hypothetical protein H2202_010702 [Exophiala xenobiotica]